MRRLLAAALILVGVLAPPVAAGAAKTPKVVFRYGTYTGKIGDGGTLRLRLRPARCARSRNDSVPIPGPCMRVLEIDPPKTVCVNGTTKAPDVDAYTDPEVHYARSGHHRDVLHLYGGRPDPVQTTVFDLTARGSRITGTIRSTQLGDDNRPCESGTHTFRLTRGASTSGAPAPAGG